MMSCAQLLRKREAKKERPQSQKLNKNTRHAPTDARTHATPRTPRMPRTPHHARHARDATHATHATPATPNTKKLYSEESALQYTLAQLPHSFGECAGFPADQTLNCIKGSYMSTPVKYRVATGAAAYNPWFSKHLSHATDNLGKCKEGELRIRLTKTR